MIETLLVILCALSQNAAKLPHIILMNDGTTHYGYVDQDDWNETIVPVEIDAPWLRVEERKTFKLSAAKIADHARESLPHYRRRMEEGWRERGGVLVQTPAGDVWVHGEEAKYAERAREWARDAEDRRVQDIFNQASRSSTVTQTPTASLGELWGGHIAVLSVGLSLCGLAVWFLILQ